MNEQQKKLIPEGTNEDVKAYLERQQKPVSKSSPPNKSGRTSWQGLIR